MNISIISFTDRGRAVSKKIAKARTSDEIRQYAKADGFLAYDNVKQFAQTAMQQSDALIFIGAAGIAVRACAPFLQGKDKDPAVVVIDENAKFVISLLSGHIGGANRLTAQLAELLQAIPVITTATDGRGVFAADTWAVEHGCIVKNKEQIKYISGAILRGEKIGLQTEYPIIGTLPEQIQPCRDAQNGIVVSTRKQTEQKFIHTLHLIPRIVHIGVGCKRNTPPERLQAWVDTQLDALQLDAWSVADISSIDLKRDEQAVLQLAEHYNVPVFFYHAQELEAVKGDFPPSAFVRKTTGTDNVCQRSAAKASKNGRCLLKKTAQDGMTLSIYEENWSAEF